MSGKDHAHNDTIYLIIHTIPIAGNYLVGIRPGEIQNTAISIPVPVATVQYRYCNSAIETLTVLTCTGHCPS